MLRIMKSKRQSFVFTSKRIACWAMRFAGLAFFFGALVCSGAEQPRPWPLWEAYAQHFTDGQGRVIDRSADDRTTSEGQAYAMFFALVDNDRIHFDKLLHWTEANLAGGDLSLRLPAWKWGRQASGAWTILDDNSASDADLWMAYDLLEAGRLWHEPRYAKLGGQLASRIAQQEVIQVADVGTWLAPGRRGFHPTADSYVVNPSYMPLPLLQRFAHVAPSGPWKAVVTSLPALLAPAVGGGFAMDWVSVSKAGIQATTPPGEGAAGHPAPQPVGGYEAIRVYLWAGMTEPTTPDGRTVLSLLAGMKSVVDRTGTPAELVSAAGIVIRAESPIGFSAAVLPYLNALGDRNAATKLAQRLRAAVDVQTGLIGNAPTYYDQNLSLFSTGYTERRFHFGRDGQLSVSW